MKLEIPLFLRFHKSVITTDRSICDKAMGQNRTYQKTEIKKPQGSSTL